jgi:hypothetical protein
MLLRPFGFIAPIICISNLSILSVPDEGYSRNVLDEGYSERTWWRLFWAYCIQLVKTRGDCSFCWYWWKWFIKLSFHKVYIMVKKIKSEDIKFSARRTWWRLFWAYMMKVILSVPDEGYSESTRWRLFWAYLMKVILSVPDEGYSERILSVPSQDLDLQCHMTWSFCIQLVKTRGDCSFCWYWWNWFIKLSFHKVYIMVKK